MNQLTIKSNEVKVAPSAIVRALAELSREDRLIWMLDLAKEINHQDDELQLDFRNALEVRTGGNLHLEEGAKPLQVQAECGATFSTAMVAAKALSKCLYCVEVHVKFNDHLIIATGHSTMDELYDQFEEGRKEARGTG